MGVDHDRALRMGRAVSAPGRLFGIPMDGLGWFASLLMGTATAFAAFFAATFVGIVFVMVHNSSSSTAIDYSFSYLRLGLPVGIVVLIVSLGYLGSLWVRRIMRRA